MEREAGGANEERREATNGGPVEQTGVRRLDDGLWMLDLGFQGRSGVVAAYLLAGGDREELALIEVGPASTLPALLAGVRAAGFSPEQLTALLVTHIHLDHAGAVGSLLRLAPAATVRVHPVGVPHLVDPSKLLASATRLYGDRMDELWGEVLPVPADRVAPLADGESIAVAGRVLTAVFTPGHASHHVAYWDGVAGGLFTGDVGGVRMAGTDYVCPPTPPPDLDLAAWAESVARMRALGARRLCLTHGGPFADVEAHLDQLLPNLEAFRALAADALRDGADQTDLARLLHDRMAAELGDPDPETLAALEFATPSAIAAPGLIRYLVKRGEATAPR